MPAHLILCAMSHIETLPPAELRAQHCQNAWVFALSHSSFLCVRHHSTLNSAQMLSHEPSLTTLTCSQIQYFSRAFQPLKNSFVETLRTVIVSVRWFLVLLLLTLWGFAGTCRYLAL